MRNEHQRLLVEAVDNSRVIGERLRGAAIYVVGASGFLASNLVAFLDVLNRRYQLGVNLHASARRPAGAVPLFQFLECPPEVNWTIEPVETVRLPDVPRMIVVHTASFGSPRDYIRDPLATFTANTQGILNLFRQAQALEASQFVYFSSAEIYGQPPEAAIPTPEHYVGGPPTLSMRSIYAESKRMAEVLGTCLANAADVPFTALRLWNLYGPGQRLEDGRVPMEFIRQAREDRAIRLASNGSPRRSFCYVWDGIRQVAATLGRSERACAFNIGNSMHEMSVLELARCCAAACNLPEDAISYNPTARVEGLQRCVPNVEAVARLLPGSACFTPLPLGLAALNEWFNFLKEQ